MLYILIWVVFTWVSITVHQALCLIFTHIMYVIPQ